MFATQLRHYLQHKPVPLSLDELCHNHSDDRVIRQIEFVQERLSAGRLRCRV